MFCSRQSRQFLGYNDKTRQDKTVFSEELESVLGKQKKIYQGVAYCIDLRLLCSFSLGFHLPMSLFLASAKLTLVYTHFSHAN